MKSVTRLKYVTAALLTRMSGGPSCRVASVTSRSLSSGSDRSAWIATAVPPAARICSAVSPIVPGNGDMPAPVVRAATATAAPACAETAGDLCPDAAAGAGHDGDLAIQDAHAHHSLSASDLVDTPSARPDNHF